MNLGNHRFHGQTNFHCFNDIVGNNSPLTRQLQLNDIVYISKINSDSDEFN